jgi:uncharacterized protein (TIRG00374 family)
MSPETLANSVHPASSESAANLTNTLGTGREKLKLNIRFLLSLSISVVFILAILWITDIRQTIDALKMANYTYVPIAIVLSLLTNILRSYRWKYVLNPVRSISIQSLFSGVAIGYMANNLLPARLGEIVRSYLIGKKEGISKSATLATIVVERLFDGVTLLLFLVLISVFFTIPLWVRQVGLLAATCLIAVSAFLILLLFKKRIGIRVVQASVSFISPDLTHRAHRLLECFLDGLEVVKHKKDAMLALVFSILAWVVEAGTYYVVSLSFDLHLPLYVAVVTVAIVNFGILLPAAPGYLGTFEFFCISALSLISIEKSVALSFALLLHAVLVLPITVGGIIYFMKEQFTLAELKA